ncbi:chemotaxis protein CheW [Marinilabilia rubra]|uniref:Chemotaxis protein CheW n=1 Tax=Marinilabilia rubra TaxID=2162893 RepID=A0A2U2BCB8_9BACT|nr:chemotaxis protein CheW [Marinilabilia rubra]PWE00673.1 chemotaxis protein CheW [Marinilabilia rubra]
MERENKKMIDSYLSFRLGDEIFALHVGKVQKILEMRDVTEVPRAPDYMKGVINLRGKVLPVIDLRIKFGMQPAGWTKTTCILVVEAEVENEMVVVGLLVDAVQAVQKVKQDEILPPPSIGSKFRSDFISGMTRVNEKFFMVLNIDLVISSDDLINIKEIQDAKEAFEKES